MARTNFPRTYPPVLTHEGGPAARHQSPTTELERTVATTMLWESTFYEGGDSIANRIAELVRAVEPETVARLAVKARNDYKLRHAPLWLAVQLAKVASGRKDGLVRETIEAVIQRPDEMGELLSLYWKDGRKPVPNQIKKGLADAFVKFTPYQFQKWNRDAAVRLRDVMFLVHPRPLKSMESVFKQIAEGTLEPADTWEVALSSGADKKGTWERLLTERKLGYMALLMNLRNMIDVGVRRDLIEEALMRGAAHSKALPFRFISAAKHAPALAQTLSDAMVTAVEEAPRLRGVTHVLVDVSGSMDDKLSGKSELSRREAASALAILVREISENVRVFTFSSQLIEVPNYRGLSLSNAISGSQQHGSTLLAAALAGLRHDAGPADRLIVITDEQSHDGTVKPWTKHAYVINVAPYKPGLETSGGWQRINGWSERIIDWMHVAEANKALYEVR